MSPESELMRVRAAVEAVVDEFGLERTPSSKLIKAN
jgi:diacylglycerol kinase